MQNKYRNEAGKIGYFTGNLVGDINNFAGLGGSNSNSHEHYCNAKPQ